MFNNHQTMSARGRKLTALTPREANSRKTQRLGGGRHLIAAENRKLFAVNDLQWASSIEIGGRKRARLNRRAHSIDIVRVRARRGRSTADFRIAPPAEAAHAVKR